MTHVDCHFASLSLCVLASLIIKPIMKIRILAFLITLLFLSTSRCPANSNSVLQIQLDDETINPVTAEFIAQAIGRAEKMNAACLVIKLDTPGGLLSSTRKIVKRILVAKVPVVVYIAPWGSRAGSAGTFITYASHIAAMAPSTNIGAAHPVDIGGMRPPHQSEWEEFRKLLDDLKEIKKEQADKTGQKPAEPQTPPDVPQGLPSVENPMENKIVQDTTAFIRALAALRGRNAEWAVQSVVKSESITEKEALDKNVIDLIATDDADLLRKIDGRTVTLLTGEVTLHTKDAAVEFLTMNSRQKFFNILANPNIAYILMVLGFFGLLFEVTHPGVSVPGILGAIFLILAFYSMQTLPTNFAGVALTVLGVFLLIAEAFIPGFGALFISGLVCLVLGAMFLFDTIDPIMRVSWQVVIITGTILGLLALFLIRALWKILRQKSKSGTEGMIGLVGTVREDIQPPNEGKVFVRGELWNAAAAAFIPKESKVRVVRIDGLKLTVENLKDSKTQ
jgi:membrane-bound serine protease (ClpP class)